MHFIQACLKKNEYFTDPKVVRHLIPAHRCLAELKGVSRILPNDKILLSSFILAESKDSSAIEGIITTQESLYKHQISANKTSSLLPEKEVFKYRQALDLGCQKIKTHGGLSLSIIKEIQKCIEPEKSDFRKIPGTVIQNSATKEIIYRPPPPDEVPSLMHELEKFLNEKDSLDPLIKMAIIHIWFETIHPFYDGNGRTGRIINILFLLLQGLLDSPILYLSSYMLRNRRRYYRLLQLVREQESYWSEWFIYILQGIEEVSKQGINIVNEVNILLEEYKHQIRDKYSFYSHELINSLFIYPYTKSSFLGKEIKVSRATANRYLEELAKSGFLNKHQYGKENYYINHKLIDILAEHQLNT